MSCLERFEWNKVHKLTCQLKIPQKMAIKLLMKNNWDLERASNNYLQENELKINPKALDILYSHYKDMDCPCKITEEGVQMFLLDLNLDPLSLQVLILAWKFRAQVQCIFTKDEFYNGMTTMAVDSIPKLKHKLYEIEDEILKDWDKFKDLYLFTFEYAKEQPSRSVCISSAILYLQMLLANRFSHLNEFCKFLEESKRKLITKDLWAMILEFSKDTHEHLQNYDPNGAWPVVIDEFVQWLNK